MLHAGYFCAVIAASSVALLASQTPKPRTLRALVAEDDPISRRVASLMLKTFGCDVDLVPNGLTALHRLASTDYDLVFLDCRMPLMDGYEVAREIRRREAEDERPRRRLIAITSDHLSAHRSACLDAGMDDYVTRPLLVEEFRRVVMRWGVKPA